MSARLSRIVESGIFLMLIGILAFMVSQCVGCTDSAAHQFAYSEPAIAFEHSIWGTKAKVSSQFTGKVDLARDAETGQIQTLHAEVESNVVDVYDAQGRRITENFLKGRSLEYGFKVEATREVFAGLNGLADKAVSLMSMGFARGGAEGPQLVSQGQSLLASVMNAMQGLGGSGDLSSLVAMLEARIRANATTQPAQ